MIKNIVFDLGGVLLKFNPQNFLNHLGYNEEESNILIQMIWASDTWYRGDRGDFSYEEVIDRICSDNPQYSDKIRYILENKDNSYILSENVKMVEYLRELKDRGYKIYILSNVNLVDLKYISETFEFIKDADGGVYSTEIHYAKPEKECYEVLFKKYNIKENESVFIDDRQDNIDMANSLGINCILCDNFENVKNRVEKIIE